MALIVSAASGNFNAGATWVGGVVPTVGDEARASTGHTITITANATCDSISNAGTGTFVLTNGVTLTADITHNNTNTNIVSISGTNSAAIVGNITSPSVGLSNASTASITHSSTGTLTITGNIIGCKQNNAFCQAINVTTSGILNVVGSITAGTGGNSTTLLCHGINAVSGTINITGNVYGNSLPSNTGVVCNNNNAINMTGAGTIVIVGLMQAGIYNSAAVNSINTAASLSIIGDFNAVNSWPAINAAASANNSFSGNFIASSNGTMPINCVRYRVFPVPVAAKTRYALNGTSTFVDMFTADNTGLAPAVGDVRAGVVYGSATGVLAVPPANSVAFGVPVDNTTGTAVLTLANVQSALTAQGLTSTRAGALDNLDTTVSSRLAPSGTLARVTLTDTATTLTNAPTVPTAAEIATAVEGSLLNEADGQAVLNAIVGAIGNTNLSEVSLVAAVRADLERTGGKLDSIPTTAAPTASAVAGAVRTELGVELGRLDASVSSRLAPSGTLATVTNLTNAPASVTPSDIWSHASRTITGGTVDTLTNAPTVPSAATIASQVRTELATELARVDVATSTRLASSAYTAPANSDIAAIKSKTDNLPASPAATGDIPSANITAIKAKTDLLVTDRLAQCSTVATTGAQLAAALS